MNAGTRAGNHPVQTFVVHLGTPLLENADPILDAVAASFIYLVVLAVASGFLDVDPTFMVYRVIYYFPYFVAGAVVQQKWLTHLFQFISTKRVKVWAWCMLIGGLWAFVYTYTIGMKPQCVFMMKWSYVTIHHETVNNIYGCGKDSAHSDNANRYWINMW
eukprot:CAMPEP_0114230822 /NCGR_PEP_ID=MMETSP0058-20121206/3687_1 /TAXON_ID=36894 /ORGANISM="Pyramimonas parkeae, CCMP726" /LENGTH=159 /DNA_ID=CAMNT_0001342073 /DNA_START=899 /DNA_END=1376 /DNA_ORIENTATION=+